MGRDKHPGRVEYGTIDQLLSYGCSKKEIARVIGMSRSVVYNYIKKKEEQPEGTRGRKRKLTECEQRAVIRTANNKCVSSLTITNELGLQVHPMTTLRVLQRCPHLKWQPKRKDQFMTVAHKQARLDWCVHHMMWTEEWKHIIFSDEKSGILMVPMDWHRIGMIPEPKS